MFNGSAFELSTEVVVTYIGLNSSMSFSFPLTNKSTVNIMYIYINK